MQITLFLAPVVAAVTPTEKVVQLLEGMTKKAQEEKTADEAAYKKYARFCRNTAQDKGHSIDDANKKMDDLKAEIAMQTADSERLGTEIKDLDQKIAEAEQAMQDATELRTKEKADFEAHNTDLGESIDGLEQALPLLKSKMGSVPQSLLQLAAKRQEAGQWQNVWHRLALMQQGAEGAPEAAAYEGHTAGILDLVQDMLKKTEAERQALIDSEANRAHAYELDMMDLTDEVEYDKTQRGNKAVARGNANKAAADATADLEATTASRDDDKKTLSELNSECAQETDDYNHRAETRAEEIKALQKATEILSSDSVAGSATKHLPALVQGVSLVSLRSATPSKRAKLLEFVQQRASSLKSEAFSLLAAQLSSTEHGDPMAKVKTMISDLIDRLEAEAGEEAQHHAWCNKELHDNKANRDDLTSQSEQLQAAIEELAASIAQNKQTVADLQSEIKELEAAMSKATEVRNEEHSRNTETIQDAKEARAAVQKALDVLKNFYDKAASADGGYSGNQGGSTGVLGMLEVIGSDFARLQSETEAGENEAKADYDKFMLASGGCGYVNGAEVCGSVAEKTDLIKSTEKRIKKQNSAKGKRESELSDTQEELDAANDTYDKLKPACINPGVSVEERVAAREQEIANLQEALEILDA
eukprot:CAMPEP_0204391260 /NCGR_PEP_ID=MMETSP0469-20131031/61157_1 /ASSEMBLY_ACC=CAM_ASM_000384 /TAXON_ID=2969 /ORGANISM="Oxyrrhis marina" /LENGTH=646 /DNA_ID=CAMNT_0051385215 /DNA_START=57 /DNA_END=1997 /DNA_ORIENTATION=+